MRRIWSLGSSNVDTTYRLEKIPMKGYTITAKSCITATGGKGANQAFAAAHWGTNVSFIGAVGQDSNGKMLLDSLESKGINTEYVSTVETQSGNAIIYVDDNGDNCIVVYPGANHCVSVNTNIAFNKNDIIVTQLEININAVNEYFNLAKQKGMVSVLNPSPYKSIPAQILRNTDIVVANEYEASEMSGIEVNDAISAKMSAEKIMEYGPSVVIITLGGKGVFLKTGNDQKLIDGYKVDVVDSQGAGDAFLGSFVYQIACGRSEIEAIEFANAVGALAVTKNGSTQLSMPDLSEVNKLLTEEKDE